MDPGETREGYLGCGEGTAKSRTDDRQDYDLGGGLGPCKGFERGRGGGWRRTEDLFERVKTEGRRPSYLSAFLCGTDDRRGTDIVSTGPGVTSDARDLPPGTSQTSL